MHLFRLLSAIRLVHLQLVPLCLVGSFLEDLRIWVKFKWLFTKGTYHIQRNHYTQVITTLFPLLPLSLIHVYTRALPRALIQLMAGLYCHKKPMVTMTSLHEPICLVWYEIKRRVRFVFLSIALHNTTGYTPPLRRVKCLQPRDRTARDILQNRQPPAPQSCLYRFHISLLPVGWITATEHPSPPPRSFLPFYWTRQRLQRHSLHSTRDSLSPCRWMEESVSLTQRRHYHDTTRGVIKRMRWI